MIEQVKKYLIDLQQTICSEIELLDGGVLYLSKIIGQEMIKEEMV